MSKTEKARAEIASLLQPGEAIAHFTCGQYKAGSEVKRVAGEVAKNVAVGTAMALATGGAAMVYSVPPPLWLAVTNKRLVAYVRPVKGRKVLGDLVVDVPRGAVGATLKPGIYSTVTLHDHATGEQVLQLNFGWHKKAAAEFAGSLAFGGAKPRNFVL